MSASTVVNYDMTVIDNRAPTVGRQFLDRVEKSPHREAYRYPRGEQWESQTWRETGDRVSRLAAGLVALGIEPEQRVGIASGTRFEWILADLAVMCAGGATTTVYPSTHAEDVGYILADSESRVVFAEDDDQIAKLTERRSELPHLDKVVTFDGTTDGDWVIGLADLEKLGEELLAKEPDVIEKRVDVDGAGGAGHADLHLGHDRPPQGRAAAALVVDLRRRRHPGAGHPRRERPAVPLAADGALVRQGAALHAARLRLRDGGRRPRRQDHRQPRRRTPHVHGRRAPHLREGLRTHRHHAGLRGRGEGEAVQPGVQGRAAEGEPRARREAGAATAARAERRLRPARLQQDPGAFRRPGPLLHLRGGRSQPRHRRVVRGRGHPHPRGLRHDRVVGRVVREPPVRQPLRHGRGGAARQRGEDRLRTARCSSRAPA